MTIEMGVIDRPVETQIIKNVSEIETQIMDNPKIKIYSLKKEGYIYFYRNKIVTERLLKIKIQ